MRQRPRRQADRGDDFDLDIIKGGKAEGLPFDEHAQRRLRRVREQGR